MKFSIITPEHNPDNIPFLLELYDSILNQTYSNWEWVLYLNSLCEIHHIPNNIVQDSRVRIVRRESNTNVIGEIKREAFFLGSGDVLVEVDHDDILTPDCLQELYLAYQDESVGFVYSDDAIYQMQEDFIPYDSRYGWEDSIFDWGGTKLHVVKAFEPSSHSMNIIWFAPDHVRSWRKSVYCELGGHNPELSVCDDHELCIRTYLHTKMYHIPKVLYIYRVTGDNTWLNRNQEIQDKTKELRNYYTQILAEFDADKLGLLKVDIGGGLNPYPGYFTIDLRESADISCDLNHGIPLPNNSVGVLNASHILEHLYDKTKIMSEIHRVLAPGGWAFIEVPSTDGRGAFQDPTHVSYWNENSFLYYTDKYMADFIDNSSIRFHECRLETHFPNDWMRSMNVCVTTAWLYKPSNYRLPGLLKI